MNSQDYKVAANVSHLLPSSHIILYNFWINLRFKCSCNYVYKKMTNQYLQRQKILTTSRASYSRKQYTFNEKKVNTYRSSECT